VRYFTRELIEMGQSEDEAVLERQQDLWDDACERYFQQLDALKNAMPPGLRRRVENYYLHDAVIRGMGQRGCSFVIMLQLDTPPESLLTFTYDLIQDPMIDKGALPSDHGVAGGVVDWQYDEIEPGAGAPPSWAQSILFSNGWEVRLHFRDVEIEEIQALIPAPRGPEAAVVPPGASQPA
jgi:hypothetical protein